MGAFAAVVLTVVSSGGSAVGKAMQKQGTRSLPRLRLDPSVLREYLRCGPWMAGISLDVAGALLMVAAVAQAPVRKGGGRGRKKTRKGERRRAMIPMLVFFKKQQPTIALSVPRDGDEGRPFFILNLFLSFALFPRPKKHSPPQVSLIQPISGAGLVILALYSHFFLGERLSRREWRAAAGALVGTVLLGATSPPDASPPPPPAARAVSVILACSALALGLPPAFSMLSRRIGGGGGRRRGGGGGKGAFSSPPHATSPPLRSGGNGLSSSGNGKASFSSSSSSTFHHRSNSSSLQQTISHSLQSRPKTPALAKGGAGGAAGAAEAAAEAAASSSPPSASFVTLPAAGAGSETNGDRPWPPGLGLRAGLAFGLSTTACRAGFALAPAAAEAAAAAALLLVASPDGAGGDDEAAAAAVSRAAASAASLSRATGLVASAALSAAGLALQTAGLKDGNSVAVCTCASVASMLSGVASGAGALAEPVLRPGGGGVGLAAASRIFAMGLTIWGVAGLARAGGGGGGGGEGSGGAGGPGGGGPGEGRGVATLLRPLAALAAAATGRVLPKKARRVLLPPGARQALRKFEADAARVPLLPTSAATSPEKKSCKN